MKDAAAQARRQCLALFDEGGHRFIWLGAGEPARERGIPSNQYLVVDGGEAMLLDPGGFHVFERVFDNTLAQVHPEHISRLFLSHQDPDITASLVSWLEVKPGVEVVLSRLWTRFIEHLALPTAPNLRGLPDEGEMITLPSGASLTFVPAHFLHAPGNFHVYDSASRTLFTGDLGASLVPDDDPDLVVTDFAAHVPLMEGFHRRYLPCNRAVELYLKRVRDLPVDRVCPQHGKVMAGDDVGRFFDWLAGLDVGFDYRDWGD